MEEDLSNLCQICSQIFGEEAIWDGREDLFQDCGSIETLKTSAQSGCRMCCVFLSTLWPRDIQRLEEKLYQFPDIEAAQISCNVRSITEDENEYILNFFSYLYPDDFLHWVGGLNDPRAKYPLCELRMAQIKDLGLLKFPQSLSTGSSECLLLLRSWIDNCLKTHQMCSHAVTVSSDANLKLPTRLLDVSRGPGSSIVALVDGEDIIQTSQYMTLSHCWGGSLSSKLLISNEDVYRKIVPLDILPRTFQDAIWLSRQLKVKYLWIDALCIIQDSKEDWNRQAMLMSDVYSNSYLNISATASTDGSGGLFRSRDYSSLSACHINARWRMFKKGSFACYNSHIFEEKVGIAPLNKRAWVLQERLLSPRNIHFAKDEVFWECAQVTASECFVRELPEHSALKSRLLAPEIGAVYNSKSLRIDWNTIVGEYTGGALTVPSDKLIALAGIAKRFRDISGDDPTDYLAGLWAGNICHELLWSTSLVGDTRRPSEFRAPSWSWASIDGQIKSGFNFYTAMSNLRLFASVIRAETVPQFDAYGPVASGSIWIRGPLCEFSIISSVENNELVQFNLGFSLFTNGQLLNQSGVVLYADDLSQEGTSSIVDGPLYFMVIRAVEDDSRIIHEGLLLKPDRNRDGVYRRVGLVALIQEDTRVVVWSSFQSGIIPEKRHQGVEHGQIDYFTVEIV